MSIEPDHEVLIIGAGFGGIGAAIALQRKGIDDVLIVEKWHGVGGTWLANTYPGVAVDIPAFIYSFSYAQRSDWSRLFAPGEELRQYAESVVDQFGLRSKLRLNTSLARCEFDEDEDLWRATTDGGEEITARFLIPAIGGLEHPKLPDIDGLQDFEGALVHTAMWNHDLDLSGKRVAVIGTGATSLQLIPEIAGVASQLDVYQRTPIWVGPKVDFELGPVGQRLFSIPPVRSLLRAQGTLAAEAGLGGLMFLPQGVSETLRTGMERRLRGWMRSQVDDPEIREKLIPQYGMGCKRPSMSNTYLKTFNRDDVELVTESIERVTPGGIVTADGVERAIDVLICATGFHVMDRGKTPPFPLIGRDGVDIRDYWDENRYQAYQGVSVPGFPNVLFITGPTGFVIGSYFWMVEATSAHAARVIAAARRRNATRVEIRQPAHDAYFRRVTRRASRSMLFTDVCNGANTYYLNYHGDAAALRPSTHAEMYLENRMFPLNNYRYESPRTKPPAERRGQRKEVSA